VHASVLAKSRTTPATNAGDENGCRRPSAAAHDGGEPPCGLVQGSHAATAE
jgi:hypothetical protein